MDTVLPRVYSCERCGQNGAQLAYVRTWEYNPAVGGWRQIGGRMPHLLCSHCRQFFDVVEGWALDGIPPVESDLDLIDQRKAAGRLWYDATRGLWRMR